MKRKILRQPRADCLRHKLFLNTKESIKPFGIQCIRYNTCLGYYYYYETARHFCFEVRYAIETVS